MKEQLFVTYEIALELKKLNFDEPCFASFNETFNKGVIQFTEIAFLTNFNNAKHLISAPLWQQAQSFLRERGVLVAERWDGWEYGAYEWDDFIYVETREQAILKAIELCQK